jgi:hypothetical protein
MVHHYKKCSGAQNIDITRCQDDEYGSTGMIDILHCVIVDSVFARMFFDTLLKLNFTEKPSFMYINS